MSMTVSKEEFVLCHQIKNCQPLRKILVHRPDNQPLLQNPSREVIINLVTWLCPGSTRIH